MSIKRLTAEEKALYLIGKAVWRQFREAPRDPDTTREVVAVGNWIEHWLTAEELDAVTAGTGMIFDEDLADELRGPPHLYRKDAPPSDEDDIPF
jgi:hypothetical protein